jgi:AraC-like DNA-binding protein
MLHHRAPAPPLSALIDSIWLFVPDGPPRHARERVLPGGTAQIIIALDERPLLACDPADGRGWLRFRGSVLSGPRSRHHLIEAPGKSPLAGIHFRPGGLRPFITMSVARLENRHVPLDELWGAEAEDLRRATLAPRTAERRLAAMEARLIRLLPSQWAPPRVIRHTLERFSALPEEQRIAAAVAGSGLSPRTFIATFRDQVGLTPKRFCRVLRFQRALHELAEGRRAWSDLALSCGYSDQPHFNRDFRVFTGLTPRRYRASVAEHRSHVRS